MTWQQRGGRSWRHLLIVTALGAGAVSGQTTLGSIVGTVRDATGATVPGVSVTVRNLGTGIARPVTSDEQGYYEAAYLIAGRYQVSAEAAGFKKSVRAEVIVETTAKFRVDFDLEVGDVQQSVEVSGAAPLLETETARIGTRVSGRSFQDLAAFTGSGHFDFIALMPGGGLTSNYRYSLNGSRGFTNGWSMDGISTARPSNGDNLSVMLVDRDALQEVRYDSVNNSAEFQHAANVASFTKSGTNELHGAVEFNMQNSGWAARSFFAAGRSDARIRNWLFSAGGPVFIPRLYNGKNRTFFFVYTSIPDSPFTYPNRINVPTLLMRQGDFSQVRTPVRDPLSGQVFAGNLIPQSRLNQTALKHQARFYDFIAQMRLRNEPRFHLNIQRRWYE
jgi:hypothetical protein